MTRLRIADLPAHLRPAARAALGLAPAPRRQRSAAPALPDPVAIDDSPRLPLVIELAEPPALNEMLDLAKQRDRRGRPTVYAMTKARYETGVAVAARRQGFPPPRVPWPRWRLERAAFRLHQLRDPLELLAGLKWCVDALVTGGWLAGDSPRHLRGIPDPDQVIDRGNRGVSLAISPVDA